MLDVKQVGLKHLKEIMETLEVEVEFIVHKHIIWSKNMEAIEIVNEIESGNF